MRHASTILLGASTLRATRQSMPSSPRPVGLRTSSLIECKGHPNIGPKNHKGPLVCPQLFPMRKLLSGLWLRTAPNSIATLQVGSCSSELWRTGTPQSGILQNRCNCKPILHLVCFVTLKYFCTLHSPLTYLSGMSWLHPRHLLHDKTSDAETNGLYSLLAGPSLQLSGGRLL